MRSFFSFYVNSWGRVKKEVKIVTESNLRHDFL